jgi:hypothetical protein
MKNFQALMKNFQALLPIRALRQALRALGDKHPLEYLAVLFAMLAAVGAWGAAYFARYQGWVAKDTEKRQLRAYVIFRPNGLERFEPNDIGHVQAVLENVGQTPVYDGTWSSGISVLPSGQIVNVALEPCESIMRAPDARRFYFGKVAYPDKDRDRVFSVDEINDIKIGTSTLLFIGRVCYRDIFKEVHRTDFCVRWRWAGNNLGPATFCENGNDAD